MRDALPGDFLLRPIPMGAGLLLVLNDHLLKPRVGGSLTGKLSDAAGLIFIPLLLVAITELLRARRKRWWRATRCDLWASLILVGGSLALAKLSPPVAGAFGDIGGLARLPVTQRFVSVQIAHDPSDMWTLPALMISWLEGRAATRRRMFA